MHRALLIITHAVKSNPIVNMHNKPYASWTRAVPWMKRRVLWAISTHVDLHELAALFVSLPQFLLASTALAIKSVFS